MMVSCVAEHQEPATPARPAFALLKLPEGAQARIYALCAPKDKQVPTKYYAAALYHAPCTECGLPQALGSTCMALRQLWKQRVGPASDPVWKRKPSDLRNRQIEQFRRATHTMSQRISFAVVKLPGEANPGVCIHCILLPSSMASSSHEP